MDSLISTFHIDWHLIVAQAINFIVVLLVLYFFALKPLKKLMDERGATISGGLDNAKKQEELLANAEIERTAIITKAYSDAKDIITKVKADSDVMRTEAVEKTKKELQSLTESNKKLLEADKAKVLDDAKRELGMMVINATERVLGSVVTEKVEKKLVEDSLKDIG